VRSGQRVRITAQLVHSLSEKQLWTRSYDRDFRNALSLQSDVALAIASEIRVKLTAKERPAWRRPSRSRRKCRRRT